MLLAIMKLIRSGPAGRERPGVLLDDGDRIDVSALADDFDEAFFAGDGIVQLQRWLLDHSAGAPRFDPAARLGAPIGRPSKIVCIGLNFRDHAEESGMPLPAEPVIFFKSTTAVCGSSDDVVIPRGGTKLDWEVELAVVIGRRTSYVTAEQALTHVAGYALHNDYSERGFQMERGGQWVKGKSADTFAPLGPFLATTDDIVNPGRLPMWLSVNGARVQDSNTSQMIFDVPTLVSYVSQFMTLLPGDVISTGTPSGVGLGVKPVPRYLRPGDVVTLGIEGLGTQRQEVVAYPGRLT
jgi:2-keto-4-pentenoate hydratase/2-oxohepta-3-ene-1,7-dioic acid hydratase in catechol pathway